MNYIVAKLLHFTQSSSILTLSRCEKLRMHIVISRANTKRKNVKKYSYRALRGIKTEY